MTEQLGRDGSEFVAPRTDDGRQTGFYPLPDGWDYGHTIPVLKVELGDEYNEEIRRIEEMHRRSQERINEIDG